MKTIFLEGLVQKVDPQKNKEMVKVYVVITDTKTLISQAIKLKTNSPYGHVSVAFEKDLNKMYSFSAWYNGLVEEDKTHYSKEAIAAVYSLEVISDVAEKMKKRIEQIREEGKTFNMKGIIGLAFDRPISDKTALFCSEFVATLFHDCGVQLFHQPMASVRPSDFVRVKKLKFEKRGKLIDITLN